MILVNLFVVIMLRISNNKWIKSELDLIIYLIFNWLSVMFYLYCVDIWILIYFRIYIKT